MTRPTTTRSVRLSEESSFPCMRCGFPVANSACGTGHRNHCPHCLWSQHVDQRPGDRRCRCRGPMRPIAIWFKEDGEGALIHRCARCGTLRSNRIAGDDDPRALRELARWIANNTECIADGGFHDLLQR